MENVKLSSDVKYLVDRYLKDDVKRNNWRFGMLPEKDLASAKAWLDSGKDLSWQEWKGLLCKVGLSAMPIDVDEKELIVGCPLFRSPSEEEKSELEKIEKESPIPPFPGGDPGHIHPDFNKIFKLGLNGFDKLVKSYIKPDLDKEKREFYNSCLNALAGVREYILNTAKACEAKGMSDMASMCKRLAAEPPATFHEAVQLMFFIIVTLWFGEGHTLTNPGRMDQTLISFYKNDIKAGILTEQKAFDIICNLYIQLNNICEAGLAISVIVGGRDKDLNIITNDLTYLCVEARIQTSLVYPTVGIAWSEGMSDDLMLYAAKSMVKGVGCPAVFNDHIISLALQEAGVSKEDSLYWMNSTCVELKPVACSNIWVASPYFNCSQKLLDVMKDIEEGKSKAENLDELNDLLDAKLREDVSLAAKENDRIWEERKVKGRFPLLSCFIDDCLEKGLDYDNGGARYNWVENSFVGLANISDALYVIDRLVFKEKRYTFAEINHILEKNFGGYEEFLAEVKSMPKYGNDLDEVDQIAKHWFTRVGEISRSYKIGGHPYEPGTFCWIQHEWLGRLTGATIDGRMAGSAFADGSGSAQGRDVHGPTSSILSTTKWEHKVMVGGMVQNIRFNKSTFQREADYKALKDLVLTYMRRGGFEIQVNMTSKEELLDAQIHPENYRNLVVRVAGYSDYFTHLNPNMQAEVISRTEHCF
ncbi:MAG: hypothetical protein IJS60_00225 [Abditibacteriota bacterium]|nr:hypothetical protein [Abditibacteriota bacterium]